MPTVDCPVDCLWLASHQTPNSNVICLGLDQIIISRHNGWYKKPRSLSIVSNETQMQVIAMLQSSKVSNCQMQFRHFRSQGSHYILILKFNDFSKTFKDPQVAFSGTNCQQKLTAWTVLQQYLMSISMMTVQFYLIKKLNITIISKCSFTQDIWHWMVFWQSRGAR